MVKITSIIFFVIMVTLYDIVRAAPTEELAEIATTKPQSQVNDLLSVDAPQFFDEQPSPLLKPKESLQKKEYFDFLSTLYRHDKTKASLFETAETTTTIAPSSSHTDRKKRTIIFRPLFAYRQQQIKRKRAKARRH